MVQRTWIHYGDQLLEVQKFEMMHLPNNTSVAVVSYWNPDLGFLDTQFCNPDRLIHAYTKPKIGDISEEIVLARPALVAGGV